MTNVLRAEFAARVLGCVRRTDKHARCYAAFDVFVVEGIKVGKVLL